MATDPNTLMAKERKVILESSDEKMFEVEYVVAVQSQVLKEVLEDIGTGFNVPLDKVSNETLAKVIEYCEYHVHAANTISEEEVKKWDQEFLKVKLATIFHLLIVAKYLDICNLLDLVSQAIADRIKRESPETMRKIFNIENDYTPEEEAEDKHEV